MFPSKKQLLDNLEKNTFYQNALKSVQNPEERKKIELMTQGFLTEIANVFKNVEEKIILENSGSISPEKDK